MTWTAAATHSNTTSKTATTSLAHVIASANVTAGNVLMVAVTSDNVATADGNTNTHTAVTDTQGNAYTKLYEYTNTVGGAAGDGACCSLWASKVKTGLTITTDSITATFPSLTAKCVGAASYALATGNTFAIDTNGIAFATQDASTNLASCVLSGMSNVEHLLIGVVSSESTQTSFALTQDADYSTAVTNGTTGSTADTNNKITMHRRIATLTGDTHAATSGLVHDSVGILVGLIEVPDRAATRNTAKRRAMTPQIRAGVW